MSFEKFAEGQMIIISINTGNFDFVSIDSALEFVAKVANEKDDIWISGEEKYPCMAVCINGEYAAVNYFQNDTGEMWLSYSEDNHKEITFNAGGEEWTPDINAVIKLNDMFILSFSSILLSIEAKTEAILSCTFLSSGI